MSLKRSLRMAGKVLLIGIPSLDEIGADLARSVGGLVYTQADMLTALMARPRDPWFDDRRTLAIETRDEIARHRHREDQVPLWSSGRYRPVLVSREAVDREAEARLVLKPEGDET